MSMNYKLAFETYWPVIEACKELKEDFIDPSDGKIKSCPPRASALMQALIKAEKRLLISKETETIEREKFKLG